MGLMNEYIDRNMSPVDFENELLALIAEYNRRTGRYLFVYSAALNKPIPSVSIGMDDYYISADIIPEKIEAQGLDIYIETPGGSGEAAEEIVKLFHESANSVHFIISGEAKSAGTLMALSGHEIAMTETGSLGPIDAQVSIGRGIVSAHDYMAWVGGKQKEATKNGILNPFDATMVAQISPGELMGVDNSLQFAHDLVARWLPQYKFKDWTKTETRKETVTQKMKEERAKQIAKQLTDHSRWRSHGRSLKIEDLENIGLKINHVEDNPEICEIIKRIQIVLRLLFVSSNTYKVFAVEGAKIIATAAIGAPVGGMPDANIPGEMNSVQVNIQCPKCGATHQLYAKLVDDPAIDEEMEKEGKRSLLSSPTITCACGFEIDIAGARNHVESQIGRKLV